MKTLRRVYAYSLVAKGFSLFYLINLTTYPCVYREHDHTLIFLKSIGRFIPVYTGNTVLNCPLFPPHAVYPCVYREHTFSLSRIARAAGLSLCIQGTL